MKPPILAGYFAKRSEDSRLPMSAVAPPARCFACGAESLHELPNVRDVHAGTGRVYNLLVCDECRSTCMQPIPTEDELRAIYPDDYYSYVERTDRLEFLKRLLGTTYRRHRYRPHFRRLLEVGCGGGEFLAKIKERGKVVGLERSASALRAAERLGVEIIVGDVEDPSTFAPECFDCIYSNHAFEHLPHPERAVESMRRWLRPGGELFIAVPNVAGIVARIFGRNWFYLGPPLHITNSTPRGIRALLERNGFKVHKIAYNSDPISIPMSVYVALGGAVRGIPPAAKLIVGLFTLAAFPFAKMLDALGVGDCMEIHATASVAKSGEIMQ